MTPTSIPGARPGESLDTGAVTDFLRTQGLPLTGPPELTQYTGGVSNWTYRLRYAEHDLVLRRPPAGPLPAGAHDVLREHRLQAALSGRFPVAPMVAACEDPALIGVPFYVMERVPGPIPRKDFPPDLQLTPAQAQQLCHTWLDTLFSLHRIDTTELAWLGKGTDVVARQVAGWTKRYAHARTPDVPDAAALCDWLTANQPTADKVCLVHNDWRLDNCVLDEADPTRIRAVLDWELATLGDPWMELGNALAYWVEPTDAPLFQAMQLQPSTAPGMLTRAELVAYCIQSTGATPPNWPFYQAFGDFRLAVIAQQVYARYYHGQTKNPAYKHFNRIITALIARAEAQRSA